jgi:hypothetical protein
MKQTITCQKMMGAPVPLFFRMAVGSHDNVAPLKDHISRVTLVHKGEVRLDSPV